MSRTRRLPDINSPVVHLLAIALLGLLAYSNTFHMPFHFDDKGYIEQNPLIRDLGSLLHPDIDSLALHENVRISIGTRTIGYLSFFTNYRLGGLDPTGYHILNLLIHLLNAVLVYALVALTFGTPRLKGSPLADHARHIALLSALLFVAHPAQTQAVTYVSQRFTSLAAFFYLSSLASYAASRLSAGKPHKYAFYVLCLFSAALAMKTKEIAFTLPAAIALYEAMFLGGLKGKRLLALLPIALTMLIIPLSVIDTDMPLGEALAGATRTQLEISRHDYLLTQFRVMATYLRLLALPINQNLDYDYPVLASFLDPQVLLSFVFLLTVIGIGVHFLVRSRTSGFPLRLFAFGVFWFFVTLSVESSFIALADVINEHRLYLSSVGIYLAFTTLAYYLTERFKGRSSGIVTASFLLLVFIFSCASYSRNAVWESELGLWADVVSKAPYKSRGHNNLGMAYKEAGLIDKAIEHFNTAVTLNPDYEEAHLNLGNAYKTKGLWQKSILHYQTAVRIKPDYAEAYFNLANTFKSMGRIDEAIEHYLEAIRYRPNYPEAHNNLGLIYFYYRNQPGTAIEHYKAALALDPGRANTHQNVAVAYESMGKVELADFHFRMAKRLRPGR